MIVNFLHVQYHLTTVYYVFEVFYIKIRCFVFVFRTLAIAGLRDEFLVSFLKHIMAVPASLWHLSNLAPEVCSFSL